MLGHGFSIPTRAVQAGSGASSLLDLISATVLGAWSYRKLRAGYNGYAMRVRRSSDSTTLDIGFVGGALDIAALLAFVGAGDGHVTHWYDQSGNGRDLVQGSAASQPKAVTGGVDLDGIMPDALSTQRLTVSSAALDLAASAATVSSVLGVTAVGASVFGTIWQIGGASGARIWLGTGIATRDIGLRCTTSASASPTQTLNADGNVISFTKTATADFSGCQTKINGGAASTFASQAVGATDDVFGINQAGAVTAAGNHAHKELIVFGEVLDAGELVLLERNQGTFYGITVA